MTGANVSIKGALLKALFPLMILLFGSSAMALDKANFAITCTQVDSAQSVVILSSDSDSILGKKVLKTPPVVFLHDGNVLVGRSPMNITSESYDAVSHEAVLEFLTPDRFSYAQVKIAGISSVPVPGTYTGEASLDIIIGSSRLQGTSVPCTIALDTRE